MSNIKTKHPFQSPAQQNQVGQNVADRRAYTEKQGLQQAPKATRAQAQHVDQFLRGGRNPETVSHFAKAIYRKAKMHFMGAPYRPSVVEHLHKGTAPHVDGKISRPWTDDENLRLLNLVIGKKAYWNRGSILQAKKAAAADVTGRPAAPSPPLQNAPTTQQFAQALRRGRTSSR